MIAGLEAGLGLVILALAFIVPVVVVVALRRVQRSTPVISQTDSPLFSPNSSHTNEAILIVQSGGRVEYMNDLAREWFGLRPEELPDLE
ncbi:MAG: PAS domain-containing protein, partial [Chloroflexota bacterium]